jgi:hypothetical protein
MSYRNRTITARYPFLSYAPVDFEPSPKLSTRNVKITQRRVIETKERTTPSVASLFGTNYSSAATPDITRKWESETVVETAETYE